VGGHIQTTDLEVHNVRETSDPTARFRICSCDGVGAVNKQSFGVTAGDVKRSGNVSFRDYSICVVANQTLAKRCLRVRRIHDLETRQQFLSACFVSCRRSTMASNIPAGRWGSSMMISVHKLHRRFALALDRSYLLFLQLLRSRFPVDFFDGFGFVCSLCKTVGLLEGSGVTGTGYRV